MLLLLLACKTDCPPGATLDDDGLCHLSEDTAAPAETTEDTAPAPGPDTADTADTAPLPEEVCDGEDNDGDGLIDEGFDGDSDGVTTCAGDCDDADPFIHPDAADVCDGIDNDCSGAIDEDFDADGDGDSACGSDCDDTDPAISGHLPEVCDGEDNDCDKEIDEGFDADGDGYTTCRGDCDDTDAAVYPDAPEICDGVANGCDGEKVDEEGDLDGDGLSICDGDCDDGEAAVSPEAEEVCDGLDNDCNDAVDEQKGCYGCSVSGDYLWCTEAQVWTDASEICALFGYHLVTIDDATENSTVAALVGSSTAWIGINDRDTEGTFVWEDGSKVTYTSWNSGEPNDYNGEDCTHINYSVSGGWNDYPCGYTQPFVCEL